MHVWTVPVVACAKDAAVTRWKGRSDTNISVISSALVGYSLIWCVLWEDRNQMMNFHCIYMFLGASSPGNRKKEKETLLLREFGSSTSTIMSHCSPKAITTVTAPVREDNIRQGQGSRLHPKWAHVLQISSPRKRVGIKMTELGCVQRCSTHCIKKKEPNDFENVSSPPAGNFTLEFQDEGELVCTWSAWNEPMLAIIPPCCGQVSFPGGDGKYGSVLPPGREIGGGVPCGFKAPFACGESGK